MINNTSFRGYYLSNEWGSWLKTNGFEAKSFVTLTFRDENVSDDRAWGLFKAWVNEINRFVVGKKYRKIYKHSYFGYVVAAERQSRGTLHFHMLIDTWVPYGYCISNWWDRAGYCHISKVHSKEAALRYILKYISKTGTEPTIWIPKNKWVKQEFTMAEINRRYREAMDKKVS